MRDYKKIKAFQFADELAIKIYKLSQSFPKDELYGLTSQIRRAAVSVPSNIAEGASRQHKKDYLNFLYNSRGSIAEVEYILQLSFKLGYVTNEIFIEINQLREETAKVLAGLINSVEEETKQGKAELLSSFL